MYVAKPFAHVRCETSCVYKRYETSWFMCCRTSCVHVLRNQLRIYVAKQVANMRYDTTCVYALRDKLRLRVAKQVAYMCCGTSCVYAL